MKIDPNTMIGTVTGKRSDIRTPAAGGSAFERVLNGIQKTESAKKAHSLHPAPGVSPSPQTFQAMSVSERAVDLLDAYARALVDPKLSLKDIAPMMDEMESVRSAVAQAGSLLSDNDPLKGIMSEVESALNAELMRFRRGDLIG